MLTHMVLITLNEGVADSHGDAIVGALRALPDQVDAIDSYRVGRDLGLPNTNADIGIVATFASPEALATYIDHPAHRAVAEDLIRPFATTTRLQMDG